MNDGTAKHAVKAVLGRAASARPAGGRLQRTHAGTLNIVYLHRVGPPVPWYEALGIAPTVAEFEAVLERLEERFAFQSLDAVLSGGWPRSGDKPPLALTFDDGAAFGDVPMYEILARHGISATMFVITDCVGNGQLMWRSKLSAILAQRPPVAVMGAYAWLAAERGLPAIEAPGELLAVSRAWPATVKDALADVLWERSGMEPLPGYLQRHRPYVDWDDLREWMRAGHAVGLHTRTHPFCDGLDDAEVESEVVGPAARLGRELGVERPPLSYPFGARLPPAAERAVVGGGAVSCALGIAGFSPRGTPAHRLDRASIERDPDWQVFGRPLVRSLR